jgi:small nuclear ribonucleoprotein (snRNP)-like protein
MADRILKRLLRERFLVTLKNGEAFDGLLVEADTYTLRLANAFVVQKAGRLEVNGDLYIPRADVAYLQKPR